MIGIQRAIGNICDHRTQRKPQVLFEILQPKVD